MKLQELIKILEEYSNNKIYVNLVSLMNTLQDMGFKHELVARRYQLDYIAIKNPHYKHRIYVHYKQGDKRYVYIISMENTEDYLNIRNIFDNYKLYTKQ